MTENVELATRVQRVFGLGKAEMEQMAVRLPRGGNIDLHTLWFMAYEYSALSAMWLGATYSSQELDEVKKVMSEMGFNLD